MTSNTAPSPCRPPDAVVPNRFPAESATTPVTGLEPFKPSNDASRMGVGL